MNTAVGLCTEEGRQTFWRIRNVFSVVGFKEKIGEQKLPSCPGGRKPKDALWWVVWWFVFVSLHPFLLEFI